MESCGIADLIATCYGGRNRRIAEAFVVSLASGKAKSFAQLEVWNCLRADLQFTKVAAPAGVHILDNSGRTCVAVVDISMLYFQERHFDGR
jgi:hypothetical protein